jgi:hypothetical protein
MVWATQSPYLAFLLISVYTLIEASTYADVIRGYRAPPGASPAKVDRQAVPLQVKGANRMPENTELLRSTAFDVLDGRVTGAATHACQQAARGPMANTPAQVPSRAAVLAV